MTNKDENRFELSNIIGQINVPLTSHEKRDLEKKIESAIGGEVKALENSKGRQYHLKEVKTGEVPYQDLLAMDIELAMLSMPVYKKECNDMTDAFKFAFDAFAHYRVVADNNWHLYSYLNDPNYVSSSEYDKILDKAEEKLKLRYKSFMDEPYCKLGSSIKPLVKQVIRKIDFEDTDNWLGRTGLV